MRFTTNRMRAARGFTNPIAGFVLGCVLAITSTTALAEVDPYAMSNESWITISGTVESVEPDRFLLDYGDGLVTVEMDDGDRDADGYKLLRGDRVTVSGKIDADLFEKTTIEAGSVFVENLNTTFFADATDEAYREVLDSAAVLPIVISRTVIRGTVTEVNQHEFTLDTGEKSIRVEVDEMPYNPLDDAGYQKIAVGDRVRVIGEVGLDLFEGREFDAETIVKLSGSG